jgi:hypothetical protein
VVLVAAALAAAAVGAACGDDDGAEVRQTGSVAIIGPPPPGGGGSVSALGTGCTTKGATTKLPDRSVIVDLDEFTIVPTADIPAGVNRIVVKNFGAQPHGLVIAPVATIGELPVVDGVVDEDAITATGVRLKRIAPFAGNTICEGTFELQPGRYVLFSPAVSDDGRSDFSEGMAIEIEIV